MRKPVDADAALAAPLYALAALFVIIPMLDFVQGIGALNPGNIQWRFASVGLLSSVLLTPMLGIALAMVVAAIRGHVVFQRIISIVNLLASVVLILLLVSFVLDVLQLQRVVPEARQREFQAASLKAIVKTVGAAIVLGFLGVRGLGISAWRTRPRSPEGVVLVSK